MITARVGVLARGLAIQRHLEFAGRYVATDVGPADVATTVVKDGRAAPTLKVVQLRERCTALGLPTSGKKAELVERLASAAEPKMLGRATVVELRGKLASLGLATDGRKPELVDRLIAGIFHPEPPRVPPIARPKSEDAAPEAADEEEPAAQPERAGGAGLEEATLSEAAGGNKSPDLTESKWPRQEELEVLASNDGGGAGQHIARDGQGASAGSKWHAAEPYGTIGQRQRQRRQQWEHEYERERKGLPDEQSAGEQQSAI